MVGMVTTTTGAVLFPEVSGLGDEVQILIDSAWIGESGCMVLDVMCGAWNSQLGILTNTVLLKSVD